MAKVGEYRSLWSELNEGDKIMALLVGRVGVTLPRDLEVWIFGSGMNAMSSPFLVPAFRKDGSSYTKEQCTEMLIHEILHRLIGNAENNPGIVDYWKMVRTEYANEPITTQNHILVYAYLEAILTELYGAEQLLNFINPQHPDYRRAVQIVAEKGAGKLIGHFRECLK